MTQQIRYTAHAIQRQAQRNLSPADIEFVVAHGRRIHSRGALHIFLGRRDIPTDRTSQRAFARLEGTTLVLTVEDGALLLITAYRNRHATRQIRAGSSHRPRRA